MLCHYRFSRVHSRLGFNLKMFAFDSRTVCNNLISKIRLLSVKNPTSGWLWVLDRIFYSAFFLRNFESSCWISGKSNKKLALKAKNTFRKGGKFLNFFFDYDYDYSLATSTSRCRIIHWSFWYQYWSFSSKIASPRGSPIFCLSAKLLFYLMQNFCIKSILHFFI